MEKKGKKKNSVFLIVIFVFLLIYSISILTPLVWAFLSSLKTKFEFIKDPLGLPKKWLFKNYIDAFDVFYVSVHTNNRDAEKVRLIEMMFNSLAYAIGCGLVATLVPCFVAFPVAKINHKFNKVIYSTVIIAMLLPIVGSLPSSIDMMQKLGLYDSLIGMYIMKANFLGMYFLVFYASFKSLSWTYAEAAFIDGASYFDVFCKIMLPLVSNTISIVFLLQFISFWNDYQTPMIYWQSYPTLAYGLYRYTKNTGTTTSSIPMFLAGCIIVVLPILILFIIFKDKLIGNLTVGGIKG